VRVVIVDDHSLLRAGLRLLLGAHEGIEIVAEASTGEDCLAVVAEFHPDVVVMDLSMPGAGGAATTLRLCEAAPGTKVVVLTRFSDYAHMREAFSSGAAGYVLKSSPPEQLIEALRTVASGRTHVDPGVQTPVELPTGVEPLAPRQRVLSLSPREYDVLRSAAAGESSKQIANRLGLSTRTVEFHKYKAMRRLQLRSRADLVQIAVELGWLGEP